MTEAVSFEKMMDGTSAPSSEHSYKLPLWQLLFLSYLTAGIYCIYWFYRNCKQLYSHNHVTIRPGLRTLGFCLPIIGEVFLWYQLRDINRYVRSEKIKGIRHITLLSILFAMSKYTSVTINGAGLPFSIYFIFIFPVSIFIMLIVQNTLNQYWAAIRPSRMFRKITAFEIIIILLGLLVFVITIIEPQHRYHIMLN